MAKGSKPSREGQQHAPAINDERFARLQTDPRFLRPNREEAKVVIDDRFKGLLSGGLSGGKKTKINKYGRKVKQNGASQDEDEMKRLYRLKNDDEREASGSGSSSSSEEEGQGGFIDYARGEGQLESSDEDSSSDEDDEDSDEEGESEVVMGNAAARRREKQSLRFADDDDVEDVLAAEELDVAEEDLSKLDAQAERTVQREAAEAKRAAKSAPMRAGDTSRLAVVNMDWDHIRAIDLYKVFSSLVSPAGSAVGGSSNGGTNGRAPSSSHIMPVKGRVLNVRVYPSNFGLERMAKENEEGPPRDIFKRDEEGRIKPKKKRKSKKGATQDEDDSDESDIELFEVDEGGEFDEEALRDYQLERLRYYYAIVTFDSPQAARYIMDEVDGTEMERTANVFDLSFVPDDMTFPDKQANKEDLADEGWRDEASEAHDGGAYKGVDFTTDALRHSKVQLTWDADDPQRSKVTRQLAQQALTVDQLRDEDFKAYLASDSEGSEEEEDDDGGVRNKMRALLGLDGEGDADEGSTFGKSRSKAFEDGRKSRGEEGGREMQITFMPGLSEAAERKRSGVVTEAKEESTRDKYLRKQREKKERRRQQGKGDEEEEQVPVEEANGKIGFDDPFFASDNDDDFEKALAAEQEGKLSKATSVKKSKAELRKTAPSNAQRESSREELQTLVESEGEGSDTGGHFSIKDILKAEQSENGKKSRWAKKKEKKTKAKDDEREHQVQENFAIDVEDERFQGVFNDHRFSLDPSHPSFIKTKNMEKLMDERRKRDKQQRNKKPGKRSDADQQPHKSNDDNDLDDLVKSVKKRSMGAQDGRSFKKKVRS